MSHITYIPPHSPIDDLWGTAALTTYNPLADGLLMEHQKKWVADDSALKVARKGRRTGFTWSEGFSSVLTASSARSAKGDNVWYMGDTKDKGREFIETCRKFAESIADELLETEEFLFDDITKDPVTGEIHSRQITAWRITFASGFRISALSSSPANIRGLQGIVIIDEAAFHKDVDKLIDACVALLIWGGKIRIISTHNGKNNAFAKLIREIESGARMGSVHHATFDDAVTNGLYERMCAVSNRAMSPDDKAEWYNQVRMAYGKRVEAMREELDAIPRDDVNAPWLDWDLILSAEHPDAGKPELYSGGPVTIGNDIARRGDLWVAWVWEQVGDVWWCREVVELRNAKFAVHDAEMDRLMKRYRAYRLIMDQTGMGEKPVEDAQRRYGSKAEGVIFTPVNRLNMATVLRERFETGRIRIPAENDDLRTDLNLIKKVVGPTGAVRLLADDNAETHADRFWAAALGIAGAADEPGILNHYRDQAVKAGRMDFAISFLRWVENTGGNGTVEWFDDDWEPIGPKVRDDLLRFNLIQISDGFIRLTPQGRELYIDTLDKPLKTVF